MTIRLAWFDIDIITTMRSDMGLYQTFLFVTWQVMTSLSSWANEDKDGAFCALVFAVVALGYIRKINTVVGTGRNWF